MLPEWADAVAGAAPNGYRNVTLFLDVTLRPTCMPHPDETNLPPGITQYQLQRAQYCGHKKRHGMKFHSLIAPNSMAVHWHGPCDGRHHDMFILDDSAIVPMLGGLAVGGVDYMIYGDAAYPVMRHMIGPIPRVQARPGTRAAQLNTTMAAPRTVACEIFYGICTNKFQAVDFARWQRQYWTAPALQYHIAMLLLNCHICINGSNKISRYFDCDPPTLRTYLSGSY